MENKVFDDFAKMATGAAGMVMDMRREVQAMVLAQIEKILGRMNLVKREEFDVAREMIAKARENQEKLEKRLTELENSLDSQKPVSKTPKK